MQAHALLMRGERVYQDAQVYRWHLWRLLLITVSGYSGLTCVCSSVAISVPSLLVDTTRAFRRESLQKYQGQSRSSPADGLWGKDILACLLDRRLILIASTVSDRWTFPNNIADQSYLSACAMRCHNRSAMSSARDLPSSTALLNSGEHSLSRGCLCRKQG